MNVILSLSVTWLLFQTSSCQDIGEEKCTNISTMTAQIKKSMLTDYVVNQMPAVLTGKDKVEIIIHMDIRTIVRLDALNQTLHITAIMSERWFDKRLTWNKTTYGNCDRIALSRKQIWTPRLELVQTKMASRKGPRKLEDVISANVDHQGLVTYSYPAVFITSCSMDMYFFPYDRHACPLRFTPVGAETEFIAVKLPPGDFVGLTYYTLNNGWELTHIGAIEGVDSAVQDNSTSGITFTMHLRRYPKVFFYFLYYPNVIINLLGTLQFLIPCNASARKITLGIGIIVMLFLYIMLLTESLPMSDSVPILLIFITATFALISFSLVFAIFIIRVHFTGRHLNNCEMPEWMKNVFLQKLSFLLLLQYDDEEMDRREARVDAQMRAYSESNSMFSYDESMYGQATRLSSRNRHSSMRYSSNLQSRKQTVSQARSRQAQPYKSQAGLSVIRPSTMDVPSSGMLSSAGMSTAGGSQSIAGGPSTMYGRRMTATTMDQEEEPVNETDQLEEEVYFLILHHFHHMSLIKGRKLIDLHIRCDWQQLSSLINRLLLLLYTISMAIMWYSVYTIDTEELESEEGLQKVTITSSTDILLQQLGSVGRIFNKK